jgi:hypothetical protein
LTSDQTGGDNRTNSLRPVAAEYRNDTSTPGEGATHRDRPAVPGHGLQIVQSTAKKMVRRHSIGSPRNCAKRCDAFRTVRALQVPIARGSLLAIASTRPRADWVVRPEPDGSVLVVGSRRTRPANPPVRSAERSGEYRTRRAGVSSNVGDNHEPPCPEPPARWRARRARNGMTACYREHESRPDSAMYSNGVSTERWPRTRSDPSRDR